MNIFDSKKNCPLCGSSKIKFLFINNDRMFDVGTDFHIYECGDCELVFVGENLSNKELSSYYKNNYYTKTRTSKYGLTSRLIQKASETDSALFLYVFNLVLRVMGSAPIIKPFGDNKLLDVGCGGGQFLNRMKTLGWETSGYDVDKNLKKIISKKHTFFENLSDINERFNLITMLDSLEHIPEFESVVERIFNLLKDDGMLVITTPIRNTHFKIFKKNWYPLDTPRHVQIFNKSNIGILLKKHGFKIITTRTFNHFSYVFESISYSFNKNRLVVAIFKCIYKFRITFLLNALILPFGDIFNLGESIIVYAQKNEN